jgi:plasmid maintenance system antidote protein VapI
MKVFVGDEIRNAIVQQALKSKTEIAAEIGISRNQLNNILGKDEMEVKYVLALGKTLHVDFSKTLKSLQTPSIEMLLEAEEKYVTEKDILKDELLQIHRKYVEALEEINQLHKEIKELKKGVKL